MKVCLISPLPPPYGGIARWSLLITRIASNTNCNIQLLHIDTAPRWRSIYDLSIIKRMFGGTLQLLRDYARILSALQQKPDVIHMTTSGGLALAQSLVIGITSKLFRVPTVLHIHFGRVPEMAVKNTFEWRVMKRIIRMVDGVVAITPSTANVIENFLPGSNVKYIPNPIDCAVEIFPTKNNNQEKKKLALFLGWVLPTKGVKELVQAWSELAPQDWELQIAGPGEEEYQEELIKAYKPTSLRFIGELNHADAIQLMAQCDLFVLPSHTEGFPNVILEAMAFGKPIIATEVGAIPEMLSDNCGLLIRPKDSEDIKRAIQTLIDDEALSAKLGKNAFEKVRKEYSADVIFAEYSQLWHRVSGRD